MPKYYIDDIILLRQFQHYSVVSYLCCTKMSNKKVPFDIERSDKALKEEIRKYFKGQVSELIFVGPKRYCYPEGFERDFPDIYHMPLRPDDIFVVTYPRSGTTWTQELVWLVTNNLDFEKAKNVPLTDRYSVLEMSMLWTTQMIKDIDNEKEEDKRKMFKELSRPATEILAETPSPRYVKTHLPFSLLPPKLLDTAKAVYVARDPRDVVVSYYHFQKNNTFQYFLCDLEIFVDWFIRDILHWSPYFEHLKEAWALRHHPGMLFLFYEDLNKDLNGSARRVADFFGKEYTDEQFAELVDYLTFDNFKKHESIDLRSLKDAGMLSQGLSFVRKGKVGSWREELSPQLQERLNSWMADNLQGTDIVFTSQ